MENEKIIQAVEKLKAIAKNATPGIWENTDMRPGFNKRKKMEIYTKDSKLWIASTSWQHGRNSINDSTHISTFNPSAVLEILSSLEIAVEALEKIETAQLGKIYGEDYSIFAEFVAQEALAAIKEKIEI